MNSKARKEKSTKNENKNKNQNDLTNKTENFNTEPYQNTQTNPAANDLDNNNHIIEDIPEDLNVHLLLEQLIMAYNQFDDNDNKKQIMGGIIQNLKTE